MLHASIFNIFVPLQSGPQVVLVNGLSGSLDLIDCKLATLLQMDKPEASFDYATSLSERAARYLLERGYLTNRHPEAELAQSKVVIRRLNATEFNRPKKFYLVPTYDCQLRCGYCFEHEVRSRGRHEGWGSAPIKPAAIEAAFSAMSAIAGPLDLTKMCTLFGGEALQREASETIHTVVNIASRHGFSLMAATNAFDLHHFKNLLGKEKISAIHVPIDGNKKTHDRLRVGKGGMPTFQRIIDNIEMALEAGVRVRVRVNVDVGALAALDEVADLFEVRGFIYNPRFSCYVKSIFPTKHKSQQSQQIVLASSVRNRLIALSKNVDATSARSLITDADVAHKIASSERFSRYFSGYPVIHDRIDSLFSSNHENALRPSHCGTSSLQILIFDPLGNIYPCNNLVGRQEYAIGTYYPLLKLDSSRTQVWHDRTVDLMPDVRRCKYALFCGGGCSFDALVENGTIKRKSCHCDEFGREFADLILASYRKIVASSELTR